MTDEHLNDLTPAERAGFDALPRELTPPPALERRVVRALRARGLVTRGHWPWVRIATVLSAAAAGFVAGVFTAGAMPPEAGPPAPGPAPTVALEPPGMGPAPAPGELRPYFLLLYEDERFQYSTPDEWPRRVEEYGGWAGQLAERGRLAGGEKLVDSGLVLVPTPQGPMRRRGFDASGMLSGFFIIRAANDAEAARLAMDHPHLRYQGSIAIRAVDPIP